VVECVALLIRILEVPGSNLRRGLLSDDCVLLTESLQANVRQDVTSNKNKKNGFEVGKSRIL
jgi:hypothetical protein